MKKEKRSLMQLKNDLDYDFKIFQLVGKILEDYWASVERECDNEVKLRNDEIEYSDYKNKYHDEYFIQEDVQRKLAILVNNKDKINKMTEEEVDKLFKL